MTLRLKFFYLDWSVRFKRKNSTILYKGKYIEKEIIVFNVVVIYHNKTLSNLS